MAELSTTATRSKDVNPGSFSEFVAQHEIRDHDEALREHSKAMLAYRMALAAEAGITLEELHTRTIEYPSTNVA